MENKNISQEIEDYFLKTEILWRASDGYISATSPVEYDISIEQVVRAGVPAWVHHLSCKNWITTKHIKDFIVICSVLKITSINL